jgi:phosphatidylserine/phosphatidylglycerophosphate/cardiolipin synthase-like enzyme
VNVQVVQEPLPMGEPCRIFDVHQGDSQDCADLKKLVAEVKAKGGRYEPFNKALCGHNHHSCFQHGKVVVVDRNKAAVSTGNFNPTNLCSRDQHPEKCNRDYTVVTQDPVVVSTIASIFEKDIEGQPYDVASLLSDQATEKMSVSPVSLDKIVEFIGAAKTSLQIQNQYLHEPRINEALIAAANRGVAVEITVSSVCAFSKPKDHAAQTTRGQFAAFDAAGISSRMFTRQVVIQGKPGYLHAKAMVRDLDSRDRGAKPAAWVGSMNGSDMSANVNREYGIFFDDQHWMRKLSDIMKADHQNPGTETWQESLECAKDHYDGHGRGHGEGLHREGGHSEIGHSRSHSPGRGHSRGDTGGHSRGHSRGTGGHDRVEL